MRSAEELEEKETCVAPDDFGDPDSLAALRRHNLKDEVAAHIREQLLHGFPTDYWTSYVEHILAVTPGEVRDVAARHLHPERATAVVVADRAGVQQKFEELQLGDVLITEVET